MHRLVDVSEYQGPDIDWQAVKDAGVVAAIVKGSEGNKGPNPHARAQILGARAVGLLVTAYLFEYPLNFSAAHPGREPAAQVDLFWRTVGDLAPFDLPVFCDVEWPPRNEWSQWFVTSASIAGHVAATCACLDQRTGRRAGIYAGPGAWVPLGGCGLLDCYASRPLWLAQYPGARDWWPDVERLPVPMPPWDRCALWQFGDRIALGGVTLDGSLADNEGMARLTGG